MTSPLKKKNMVVSNVDSFTMVDEVVQSIVKIKKQKQRPNSERIHAMMLKSHPDLSVTLINENIEVAINEGLVVNHLHNGVYSYRVAMGNASQLSDKIVDDKSIEDAVKSLFYESGLEYSVDKLEVLIKCRFPQGSLFNSNLHVVIRNTCTELVELGRISRLKNFYKRKDSEGFSEFDEHSNDSSENCIIVDNKDTEDKFSKTPPFISPESTPRESFLKADNDDNRQVFSDLNSDHSALSSNKDHKANLKLDWNKSSLKRTHDILDHDMQFSDDSSEKPKRRRTRNLQLSFLYDSLSTFFSVTSYKRSCTTKKLHYNMDEHSNSDNVEPENKPEGRNTPKEQKHHTNFNLKKVKKEPELPKSPKNNNFKITKIEKTEIKKLKSQKKLQIVDQKKVLKKESKKKALLVSKRTVKRAIPNPPSHTVPTTKAPTNHFNSDTESLPDIGI